MNESKSEYRVRRLTARDTSVISALGREVWGEYSHGEVYDPEQMAKLNSTGALISVVALDSAERVVGHYSLARPTLGRIAETGEAMVLPEHRGRHLMEEMRSFLEREAVSMGLLGLSGQPVTHHLFSQKVYERFDCHPTGVLLASYPRSLIKGGHPQRTSSLLYFKYLVPPPRAHSYLPGRHRAMLERIYAGLKREVHFEPSQPPSHPGRLDSVYLSDSGQGWIYVREAGYRTPDDARQICTSLCQISGAAAVYLELPLNQPQTPRVCSELEERGFIFGGIKPGDGADLLLMQFLAVPLDIGLLQIESEFARELVKYTESEMRRLKTAEAGSVKRAPTSRKGR